MKKEDEKGLKYFHDNLKELNEFNTELYINYKKKNIKNILYLKKKENIKLN